MGKCGAEGGVEVGECSLSEWMIFEPDLKGQACAAKIEKGNNIKEK